jgi:hypothetical protein
VADETRGTAPNDSFRTIHYTFFFGLFSGHLGWQKKTFGMFRKTRIFLMNINLRNVSKMSRLVTHEQAWIRRSLCASKKPRGCLPSLPQSRLLEPRMPRMSWTGSHRSPRRWLRDSAMTPHISGRRSGAFVSPPLTANVGSAAADNASDPAGDPAKDAGEMIVTQASARVPRRRSRRCSHGRPICSADSQSRLRLPRPPTPPLRVPMPRRTSDDNRR